MKKEREKELTEERKNDIEEELKRKDLKEEERKSLEEELKVCEESKKEETFHFLKCLFIVAMIQKITIRKAID